MPQPKVSIIVPVYNVERYLKRCIQSLTMQSLENIEILLVDDSSTDSSLEICNELAKEDNRIHVITKPNEGAGKARNAALQIAQGEYIGFVDSDDFVNADMFKTLVEKAESCDADLVLSGVVFVDGNMFSKQGDYVRKHYFDTDTPLETVQELKELRFGIVGARPDNPDDSQYGMSIWKNLFKTEIIKQHNLTFQSEREMLSEDALFMIDYIACIRKAVGIPDAFYHYCRNEESISKSYKKDRFEKSLVFVNEVEKRFKKDSNPAEYQLYIDRFWQAMCRVLCTQEILNATRHSLPYTDLKEKLRVVCTHPLTVRALKSYPLCKLSLKQRVFAYGIKYRLYFLLKILVGLRSRA